MTKKKYTKTLNQDESKSKTPMKELVVTLGNDSNGGLCVVEQSEKPYREERMP